MYLKMWIIIVMVMFFSFHPTFADSCSWSVDETLTMINELFKNLWRLFSWIWIILWNFAWVLMTNTLIYWEFMNLDSSLRNVRQLTRSIANYALWFIFIYNIFKYIFSHGEKLPIDTIKQILFASVLVQASWFFVMVLVDLSTIGLATVSSFPAQVMVSSPDMMETMKQQIWMSRFLNDKKVVVINAFSDQYLSWDNTKWFVVDHVEDPNSVDPKKETIDALLPSPSNLWWSFMYLWFTALKAQNYVTSPAPSSASCVAKTEKVITNLILNSWLLIIYSLALVLLIVLLVMRLWYLWVFIAISPIIIVLYFIKDIKFKASDDIFDLKKAIFLIFQPVLFAFWISIMFLVVLMVQKVFSQSITTNLSWWVTVSNGSNSSTDKDALPKVSSVLENAWIVTFHMREWAKSMKDIVLALITLILMWQLVKLALTWTVSWFNGNSSLAKRMDNLVRNTWKLFWQVGVVPTPTWMMWFNQVWDWETSKLWNWAVWRLESSMLKRDKSTDTINELMWWTNSTVIKSLSFTQKQSLERASTLSGKLPSHFVKELENVKKDNLWLTYSEIKPYINNWLDLYRSAWVNSDEYKQMNSYFWWDAAKNIWWNITSKYNDKEKMDIDAILQDIEVIWSGWFSSFYKNVFWSTENVPTSYEDFKNKGQKIVYNSTSESS